MNEKQKSRARMKKVKRRGIAYAGGNTFGLSLIISINTWQENYDNPQNVKYIDIRSFFICWIIWLQIPIKRYGITR